ncbi:MAG: hypothetical protein ACPLQP_08725 [Moorellaceae bacterium]
MSEEIQNKRCSEEVYGKEGMREILIVLDWMFRLLHASIQDVKNEIRWLADRLDQVHKDLMNRDDMLGPK